MLTLRRACFALPKIGVAQFRSTFSTTLPRSFSSSTRHSSDDFSSPALEGYSLSDPQCNVTHSIASRIGTNLHHQPKHPLHTIKHIIQDYWQREGGGGFVCKDDLSPIVSVEDNFDSLLIPQDHVSRSKSDTYYLNDSTVLRCHTSAHQVTLLKQGLDRFLVTGDVYRYVKPCFVCCAMLIR
jgi:phenylalanyl-tRNA synthetase alpha chain